MLGNVKLIISLLSLIGFYCMFGKVKLLAVYGFYWIFGKVKLDVFSYLFEISEKLKVESIELQVSGSAY